MFLQDRSGFVKSLIFLCFWSTGRVDIVDRCRPRAGEWSWPVEPLGTGVTGAVRCGGACDRAAQTRALPGPETSKPRPHRSRSGFRNGEPADVLLSLEIQP
ncbi:hypothetical protein HMPREF9440_00687, partial [Sutterella parvirubra YIT 11816]